MIDWQVVQELGPYSWNGIGTALLCGAIVGLERQIRGKPVGIRTAALIILGTYLFLVGGSSVVNQGGDPSRVIGQIITGIGFLGAGVMLARDGVVVGVTSAATIWALAAIGIAVGLGMYGVSIVLSLVIVGVLLGVDLLEDTFQSLTRGVHRKYSGWRRSRGDSNEP
ncbi:MgtC/SapB family protein [Idiomarina sp.]|uniref:MgtC/SapB family protein n=1 Tax=Idiomarina sp. TaxID=1874361 RepID=UPI003A8DE666